MVYHQMSTMKKQYRYRWIQLNLFAKLKIPEYDLTIAVESRLLEIHSTVSTDDPKVVKKLEKEINKKLEEEITRIIKYCINLGVDVFDFCEQYKISTRNTELTEDEWHEKYRNMKVNVHVKTRIIRNGVFE